LQRAQVLAGQQRVGVTMTRQATKHRKDVRRELQSKILRYLRVVGRVAAKQNGELSNQFPLPPGNATEPGVGLTAQLTVHSRITDHNVSRNHVN
jgi:hypothetical protein